MKDKREVILEFHSSPDAILNALHQAGWQVIPKASEQPLVDALNFFKSVIQSGEPWTATCQKVYDDALAKVKK